MGMTIWVIVDHLTKSAHFIHVGIRYRVRQYAELYMSHIIHYHDILKTIISSRGSIFVERFWEQLHECLGTHLIQSSAYHPQTDGQTEGVNQIIEDKLRACVLNDGPKWGQHLPLAKFVTPHVTKTLIKFLKPQLTPKARTHQVTKVEIKFNWKRLENPNYLNHGPDGLVQEFWELYENDFWLSSKNMFSSS
jgi:hypothetical protein